jgi:hypothetical protein
MAITIKHAKTDTIADWTQADLDAQIALGNFPAGTVLADIVLPSDWNNDHTLSGTVPIANGGTGQTTATQAINALLPSQTSNTGKVLSTDGTNTSWIAAGGVGTVTSVALTAPSIFSVAGSPITSSGTLALTYSGTALPVANGGSGATTLTGYVKGNGTSAFTASSTVPSTDITGLGTMSTQNANSVSITGGSISGTTVSGYIPTTDRGIANGVASLDGSGTVPVSQLPAAVLGALSYQGTWNASTNTPTLTSSTGTKGYYYVVNVAGSTNLNGITDWVVGDWAVYNGSAWQKVDNTDAVTSVNGYTGTVVLTQTDISGTVPTSRTITAGTGLTGGGDLSANRTLAIDSTVATLTGTQTLTNKTLTAPKVDLINDTNGNEILGFSPTTSATDYLVVKNGIGVGVPLHVYADGSSTNTGMHIQPKGTGLVTISDGTDFNKGIRFRSSGSAASAVTLLDAVSTAGRVVTLPDATTTLVGRDTTDTLTNKSISGSTNTLSNIGNSSLTNSAITINGTSTSLGGSINVGTVTSVTGTAPVVSSGGATPAISMAAASTTVDGYLTSTDWNTFNSKGSGTVTAVSVVSANGLAGTSSGGATPALTLSTTVTGLLKGNGTAISAATSGTDYAPATSGTSILYGNGSGGFSNVTIGSGLSFSTGTLSASGGAGVTSFQTSLSGLTPSTASTGVVTLAGTLGVASGGTGLTTLTANYVPYGNGTSALANSASFTYNNTTGDQTAPQQVASNGIIVNAQSIAASYTIASGNNAMSVGPVTVAATKSVTVTSGSRWVVL